MAWVTITGDVVSTATKFGGTDHGNKIANMFNGSDITDTVTIHSSVIWTFNNGAFKLNNPAGTFKYLIVPAAILADRSLSLPLITGADTLASLGLAQTFTAVQTMTSPVFINPELGTPTSGVATNLTGTAASLTAGTVTTNANLTGDVTSTGNATAIAAGVIVLGDIANSAKTEMISIALGNETTVLAAASTSVPVVTYHMPYAFTLTNVKVGLTAAGTGAALVTIDVHEAGTTVLSTKVTVDASEKTSATAATQPVISDSALAADSLIEIFVDLIDTNNVAAGAKVYLIGYQT